MIPKRPRNLHCGRAERDAIRERAAAAGKTVTRFLLDPVVSGDREDGVPGLTPRELAELCEGLRAVIAFMRSRGGRQGGAVPPAANTEGPLQGARVRLSVSATDGEWATVRERAAGRGLSISDFLVGLALPTGSASDAGPLPALNGMEQREALDAIRQMRGLLPAMDDAAPSEVPERHAAPSPDAEAADPGGPERAGCSFLPDEGRAAPAEGARASCDTTGPSKTPGGSGRSSGENRESRQGSLL